MGLTNESRPRGRAAGTPNTALCAETPVLRRAARAADIKEKVGV
jgi:hypothetical protein